MENILKKFLTVIYLRVWVQEIVSSSGISQNFSVVGDVCRESEVPNENVAVKKLQFKTSFICSYSFLIFLTEYLSQTLLTFGFLISENNSQKKCNTIFL